MTQMQSRCDNPVGREELYLCNAELVDGGYGIGGYCPMCNLRDKNEDLLKIIDRQEIRIHGAPHVIEGLPREVDAASATREAAVDWLKGHANPRI